MPLIETIAAALATKAGAAVAGLTLAAGSVTVAGATGHLPGPTQDAFDQVVSTAEEPTEVTPTEGTLTEEPTEVTPTEEATEPAPTEEATEPIVDPTEDITEPDPTEDPAPEPTETSDEEPAASHNPVSEVVGVAPGDPGFGEAVSDAARQGGLGSAVSEAARGKGKPGEDVDEPTEGEETEAPEPVEPTEVATDGTTTTSNVEESARGNGHGRGPKGR